MTQFATEVLGKGVVIGKDVPNFIANRIGVYGFMATLKRALAEGYTVGEVDAILGPIMGRPKSAVFRTVDLSGLDTTMHVANNLYDNAPNDEQREIFRVPAVISEMVKRGWLGEKTGQGFYKRIKNADGESTILELNLKTLEYEPQQKVRFPSLGEARTITNPARRMLAVLNGDDRASQLARETTADSLIYAANRAQELADSIVAVDEAMRWGFNMEMGSFEQWDVLLTIPDTLHKVMVEARTLSGGDTLSGGQVIIIAPNSPNSATTPNTPQLPALVQRVQTEGKGTFYTGKVAQRQYFDFNTGTYKPVPTPQGVISLGSLKTENMVIPDNGSASTGSSGG